MYWFLSEAAEAPASVGVEQRTLMDRVLAGEVRLPMTGSLGVHSSWCSGHTSLVAAADSSLAESGLGEVVGTHERLGESFSAPEGHREAGNMACRYEVERTRREHCTCRGSGMLEATVAATDRAGKKEEGPS